LAAAESQRRVAHASASQATEPCAANRVASTTMIRVCSRVKAAPTALNRRTGADTTAEYARVRGCTGDVATAAKTAIIGHINALVTAPRRNGVSADAGAIDTSDSGLIGTNGTATSAVIHILSGVNAGASAIRQWDARGTIIATATEHAVTAYAVIILAAGSCAIAAMLFGDERIKAGPVGTAGDIGACTTAGALYAPLGSTHIVAGATIGA